jgi:hypothetical protein
MKARRGWPSEVWRLGRIDGDEHRLQRSRNQRRRNRRNRRNRRDRPSDKRLSDCFRIVARQVADMAFHQMKKEVGKAKGAKTGDPDDSVATVTATDEAEFLPTRIFTPQKIHAVMEPFSPRFERGALQREPKGKPRGHWRAPLCENSPPAFAGEPDTGGARGRSAEMPYYATR